jgi:2,3-bisphosphoglycerate-dependent phosphoglycerate mutase
LRFYFIRHGQSTNNAKFAREGTQFDRSSDPQMTPLGVMQAEALADFLLQAGGQGHSENPGQDVSSGFGFTHLYTSLMIRSVHTAVIIGRSLGLQPVAWPETHERGGIYLTDPDSGEPVGLPGNPRPFFEQHFPDLQLPQDLGQEGWWGKPYESREQSRQRAQAVIEQLIARHGGSEDRVALVSHGGFFQEVVAAALGIPTFGEHWLMLHNTGIARLDSSEEGFILQFLNRLDWLPPALIS